jgi:hypothetical protein
MHLVFPFKTGCDSVSLSDQIECYPYLTKDQATQFPPCISPPYTLFFLTKSNMAAEVEKTGIAVDFLDPECFKLIMLTNKPHSVHFVVSYIEHAFELYAKKKLILTAYLSANHWIPLVILPKQ